MDKRRIANRKRRGKGGTFWKEYLFPCSRCETIVKRSIKGRTVVCFECKHKGFPMNKKNIGNRKWRALEEKSRALQDSKIGIQQDV